MADNKFAYMDMPLQIGFQYAGPLDKYAQFETRALADAWLNGALSYEGALVRVKETDGWHVYKVEIVGEAKTFVPAFGFELTEGKVANSLLNYTVNEAIADKVVVTNSNGFVDQALLNVTSVGGEAAAGKIVKVGDTGVIDSSLIPSIAIGEDLGAFATWEAAEAGAKHAPEHGDTIAVGEGEEKAIYICLNPNAETFADKFTLLRPATGVVSTSEFTAHTSDVNIHITADERIAWNKKLDSEDIVAGTNISVSVNEETGAVTINNTYELPKATTTTLGGVVVGGGLNVDETGVVSINMTNLEGHFYTQSAADEKFYIVKEGEEGKVLSTNDFTTEEKNKLAGLENYTLEAATAEKLGGVKIGSGLNVTEDGTISANILWTKSIGLPELIAGEGEGANKYYQWDKVCEVKIYDENGCTVFPAEYIVKDGKTRIEFPADFPADGEVTTSWTVLVGPAIL
jgi:hypothetical protein